MEPEKKSNGALVGLIVIIVILIIGGIYFWQTNKTALKNTAGQSALTSQDAASLNSLDNEANGTDTNVGVDVTTIK